MGQVVCSTEHTHEFALYLVNASMTNNDEEASKCSLICNHGYRSACTIPPSHSHIRVSLIAGVRAV